MSRMKQILTTVLFIIFVSTPAFADWKEGAKAIDISGGEDHTLVLTKNKSVWACGPNGKPGYWYGVLGTGSSDTTLVQKTLVRVWDGDMNTPSDYLEHISDIGAGWKHSLALDVNSYVWAWGNDDCGQLGNGPAGTSATPVRVLRGEQAPEDPNNPDPNLARIIALSAGRSGQHSLAVDANGYAYGWVITSTARAATGRARITS